MSRTYFGAHFGAYFDMMGLFLSLFLDNDETVLVILGKTEPKQAFSLTRNTFN